MVTLHVRLAIIILVCRSAAEGFAVPRASCLARGRAAGPPGWCPRSRYFAPRRSQLGLAMVRRQREDGGPAPATPPPGRRAVLQALALGQWLAAVAPAASDDFFSDAPANPAFEPGGAVLRAQRAAADAEDALPQTVGQPRALGLQDAEAMFQLTRLQGWDNTLDDLKLLLSMQGSRAFGIFSGSAQLVAMCACTHLPAGGGGSGSGGAAWLSYVITRKDFRRRGLARQTCTAALEWLDGAYPGCSIGLYGEPTKAAPLYQELGFRDVGTTRFWSGSFGADAILAADSASTPSGNGKRAVNSRVRAITVMGATALTAGKGSVLLEGLLAEDEQLLGCSRAQALRVWQKETPYLSWVVPDVDRALVARIFAAFCDKTSRKMTYQGLRDLNLKTAGIEVAHKEYQAFCRRVGVSPAEGFSEDALFEIYAQPGNNATFDAGVLFGREGGQETVMGGGGASLRGWVMGRRTVASETKGAEGGYFIGPLVARDDASATALLIAALRGAAVDHKLRDGAGQFKVELLGVEVPGMAQTEARQVLESLGFKAGGQSRYMVRGDVGKIYPARGSRIMAASSFEYA
eukprot:Tamp_03095.p2 GENE.Tamp_03095~~Tamp_03095.p2  ORF type:complete len:576 (+),score=89.53 Tamp_03095:23-1750(+)